MNVFITGGTSGIGLELARHFIADGHIAGVCSFEPPEQVTHILPGEVRYYQADVTDQHELANAIHRFNTEAGSLDIVIANAGINHKKTKIPDFDRARKVIDVNVTGVLNTFEPAIDIMKKQGNGQLVALASIAGTIGLPGTAAYGASKSAVINLCESLEIDLHHFGIHVTTIAPGFIDSPLTRDNKHKMPFKMTLDDASKRVYKAIIDKKGFYIFPFPMRIISRILYHLPRGVYKWFMKKDPIGTGKG